MNLDKIILIILFTSFLIMILPTFQIVDAYSDHTLYPSLVEGKSAELYLVGQGAWNLVIFLTGIDIDETYKVEVRGPNGLLVTSASVPGMPGWLPVVILSSQIPDRSVYTVCASISGGFTQNCESYTHVDTGVPESASVLVPH